MPTSFDGLPLLPLIVHATVVMIPLAAAMVLLAALWPRFRNWAGPMPLAASAIGLVLVPLLTSTGEDLEKHVQRTAALERHTHLADGLLPWMIALVVISAIGYAVKRRTDGGQHMRRAIAVATALVAVIAVTGATVQVARIGHSGAQAAWQDTNMSSTSQPAP